MGNFEKLVLLTVVFLVVVVLGVSFHSRGKGEVEAGPLTAVSGERTTEDGAYAERVQRPTVKPGEMDLATADAPIESGGSGESGPDGLDPNRPDFAFDAKVELAQADGRPELGASNAGALSSTVAVGTATPSDRTRILRHVSGLEATRLTDDYMTYTVRDGDTFTSLSERFYGDRSRRGLLRDSNEGMAGLKPGEVILVPLYDASRRAEGRGARGTWGDFGRRTGEAVPPSGSGNSESPTARILPGTYVVQEGDTLSEIAQKLYGRSRYWNQVFEANRDLLDHPDDLRIGMELVIPQL